jgi:crotonobetainyl-CoA:carnitine CoA-transferase CaiB-like acyl-CoA transferase
VPAARVRTMGEAVADPQIATRGVIHRHNGRNSPAAVPQYPLWCSDGGSQFATEGDQGIQKCRCHRGNDR